MATRILLAQSRLNPVAVELERRSFRRVLGSLGCVIETIDFCSERTRAIWPATLLARYDGVILGGSGDFFLGGKGLDAAKTGEQEALLERVEPFARYILEHDVPTLGICFGHQLLAHFLGARVVADPEQEEKGVFMVTCLEAEDAGVLAGLPERFAAMFTHRDSVVDLPPGAVAVVRGARCQVAAFRWKKHVYGVQFHPELDRDEIALRDEAGLPPIEMVSPEAVAPEKDTPEAHRVLENFARLCQNASRTNPVF